MSISDLFIKRPIMTTLVMIAVLLAGLIGYNLLPVSDLPNVDFPTIMVTAMLPGASPETMASAVATPLERQFSTISGLDSMTSTNALGTTLITLQFNLDKPLDSAALDVQTMITKAAPLLPQNMPTPPSFQKVNPADQPVIYMALSSPTLPLSAVNEFADTLIAQRVSMLQGVAQVQIMGTQKYAVRIQLNPYSLASRGIGINEVYTSIQAGNVLLPTGTLYGKNKAFTIDTIGQLYNASYFNPLIVAYKNGSPVRISDIGLAKDDVQDNKQAGWFFGTRAIILAVQRQPGTNTISVVNSIKELLPTFRKQMPASVNLDILYDRSLSIRNSVYDVKFTLTLAIVLVIMVIFLFLRNLSATIIPSLTLPMSIIGTFAAMYLFGYSIDTLSLMALTLSVGFVVDDAIVMLENIVRHVENGEPVYQAALNGSKEIGFTILSMTLSLVAVFIPVLFMGGVLGRLLHEFAVTISLAILISGIVSLTLTPMLCSRFIKPHSSEKHGALFNFIEDFFKWMLRSYERSLKFVLRHHRIALIFSFLILIATIFLFKNIPMGFLPSVDTGQIFAFTQAQQGISFDDMKEHQLKLAAIVKEDPNIDTFMSSIGASGPNSSMNTGRIFMRLKPREERKLSADEIIQELRPKVSKVPGIMMFMQNLPLIRIGGMLTKSQYQYTLESQNASELYKYSQILEGKMRGIPILQDVTSDLQITNPEVKVNINRDAASALGVSAVQVEDALYSAYGSRQVSTIYTQTNQYFVIMELLPKYQVDPSQLSLLYVRSSNNNLIPLSYVASLKNGVGPLTVNHFGQLPAVTISFNLKPGIALSEAVTAIEKVSSETLPQTVSTGFQGAALAFKSSSQGLWLLLIMAIVVIYIVLGILYESFVHPITILSGLPSAGVGALLTLMIFHMELNIYAFVGIIMLVGIVKKNAIMMIDFALDAQRRDGKSASEAIFEGCIIRFRPIMMTTMSALMGTLPIAIGFGSSSEAQRPLGMAVVGGLLFSQFLTLYITPVVYTYMDKIHSVKKHKAVVDV
ncbi:MAG: efflux RND transporter permease subunit [Nitrospirae bacterium]|nr:efflux RND transporter permease subunit [Nitrospirota bacterium]